MAGVSVITVDGTSVLIVDGRETVHPVTLTVHQYPGQVRHVGELHVGELVFIDGDPFEIMEIKPKPEDGVFIDYGSLVEPRIVVMTVQRYDETKSA